MLGKLTVSEGVIATTIAPGAYMDAAVLENRAAFEIAATEAIATIGPNRSFTANLTLSVDMRPDTMRALGLLLLTKCGAPAFNETEWKLLAHGARTLAAEALTGQDAAVIQELAQRIEEAYS